METDATKVLTDEDIRMRPHLTTAVLTGARGLWGFKSPLLDNEVRFRRQRTPEELARIKRKRMKIAEEKRQVEEEQRLLAIEEEEDNEEEGN